MQKSSMIFLITLVFSLQVFSQQNAAVVEYGNNAAAGKIT